MLDVLNTGRPPAARHPDPHPRGGLRQRGAGPGGAGRRAAPSSSTRCCARSPPTTSTAGWSGSRPPYDEDAEEHLAVVHSHPRWIVSALWDALGGGRAGHRGPAGGGQRTARGDAGRPAPAARPPRSCWTPSARRAALPGRWSPYAVRMAEGGEPGALDAVRDGSAGVQDEGSQLVAAALAAAPVEGADTRWLDGCAGPGGKAALLAALAAQTRRRPARRGEAAAPRPARRARAGRQPRAVPGDHRRRHPAAVAARLLRPGPDGRALLRPRRAAPAPGGPLAAPPGGPGELRPAATRAAARGVEGGTGRRGRRLRDLLAAPRGDQGRRRGRAQGARRGAGRGGVDRRPPAAARACPRWATGPTSSCGRTCTARTRCTWPCCGARPDPAGAASASPPGSGRQRGRSPAIGDAFGHPPVRGVVVHRVVLRRPVVPERDVTRAPAEAHLVLGHMRLLEQQTQHPVALVPVPAHDAGGERGVDEEHPASGGRMRPHHRVLDRREVVLEGDQPLRGGEPREARDEVVHRARPFETLLHLGAEGCRTRRPCRPTSCRRRTGGPRAAGGPRRARAARGTSHRCARRSRSQAVAVRSKRATSGSSPAASSGLVSSSPQLRAKARCSAEPGCCPRKKSTFHSSSARSSSSRTPGASGRVRSTPPISAPMTGPSGTTSNSV